MGAPAIRLFHCSFVTVICYCDELSIFLAIEVCQRGCVPQLRTAAQPSELTEAAFLRVAAVEAVPWWPQAPSMQIKSRRIMVAAEMGFKEALSVRVTITSLTYCTKPESGEWLVFASPLGRVSFLGFMGLLSKMLK